MSAVYTSVSSVRTSSGMSNATNIPDAYITTKIEMAQGIIDGTVSDIYVVPFSSDIPDMIEALALNLSVALLYIDQYGGEAEGSGIDGQKLLDNTLSILENIKTGKIKLRKSDGTEYTRSDLRNATSYPTATTEADGTTARKFTANKIF